MSGLTPIPATYDYRLVTLSVVIAILASYAALDLAGRVTANRGRARLAWLMGGALAMGSGIWSMHYTGMLAFRLPIRVYYHVPTVALSLLAAVLASSIALYVVSRERMTPLHVAAGSLLMGTGIASMHYIGMAAMRLAAMHHYHRGLWVLSVVLAVVISFVALLLISRFSGENRRWKLKSATALVMGLAIPVMHYTGMAAVSFMPTEVAPDLSQSVEISGLATVTILATTFVILGFVVVTSLVDRQLSAQQLVVDNERKMLRALIDNVPDFMYVKDTESRFVVANLQVARAAGVKTPEELLGKTDFDYYPAKLAKAFYEDEQRVIRSGQPLLNREEKVVSVGNEVHILTTKVPLRDSTGRVTGIAGVGRDISARKKVEDALREAERKYRAMFDGAIFGIFQSTRGGRLLSVNSAMARTFGYDSPEEMIASVTDLSRQIYVDPQRRDELMLALDSLESVRQFEYEAFRKDGSKIWLATSIRAIRQDGVVVRYEGMNEDITERKRAEKSLNLLRMLMDQSNDAIEVIDPDTLRFLDFNERACLSLGYSREELLSRSIFDVAPTLDATSAKAVNEQLLKSGSGVLETIHRRKDGSTFPVEVTLKRVLLDRAYQLVVVRDMTDRRHLQHQLLQAQKLESVGQLAAGIAHEINTPTQYIGDNVRFLKDAFQDLTNLLTNYERLLAAAQGNTLSGETVQEVSAAVEHADVGYLLEEIPKAIEQTLEGVTRVSALVSAMKEFSHPGTKEKTAVDLNHAIQSTITVARNEWKYVADLETEFDPSLPLISCQPGEFNQVILNLIVNAAQAIADVIGKAGSKKGKITVQTRNCPEWAEIRIQDTGSGIPEKVRARIFDPFFTTKEIGKGTGQGLAIARSVVVDKHGGTIHFETEEGKGTTFIIRLPYEGKALAAKTVSV